MAETGVNVVAAGQEKVVRDGHRVRESDVRGVIWQLVQKSVFPIQNFDIAAAVAVNNSF